MNRTFRELSKHTKHSMFTSEETTSVESRETQVTGMLLSFKMAKLLHIWQTNELYTVKDDIQNLRSAH